MKDCNCGYCMGGEILAGFGIKICDLKVSQLILFKEQSHPGRVIVAYKDHVSELVDISDEERNLFFEDVATAAKAMAGAGSMMGENMEMGESMKEFMNMVRLNDMLKMMGPAFPAEAKLALNEALTKIKK